MPPLDGATEWLNSEPLGPAELRGRVVLVNFWTLTCINWLRTEPYVRAWSQAYRDDGLVVIGVHTPEFSFEHDIDRVRRAVAAASDRLPGRGRQRLRDLARVRQPLLAGALLRRRRRRHPRPALRRRALRAVRAGHPATARRRARARTRRRDSAWRRRPTGTTCARPRPTSATGAASTSRRRTAPALDERRAYELPERLRLNQWAPGRRVDDRARERRARTGPAAASPSGSTPATRISCCPPGRRSRSRSACSSTARLRARHTASTSTRTATACSGTAASTSSCASTARSASGRWRSRCGRAGVRLHVRRRARHFNTSGPLNGAGRPW